MSVTQEIHDRLDTAFQPSALNVIDDSERHRGHAGYQEGGESHFIVEIQSGKFDGMSRIGRHRAVHEALGKPLLGRIHALELRFGG